MNTRYLIIPFLFCLAIPLQHCTDAKAHRDPDWPQFSAISMSEKDAYWNNGKAEICSFDLEQARYGEIRKGEAIMVFVTEPFSALKQVKLDNPGQAGDDKMDVLKLNFTRKFFTGIYPYSTETSVFLPYDQEGARRDAVKLNASVQEWCGHTFTQLNQKNDVYKWVQYSYFETEGDHQGELKNCIPEDEIWSMVRMGPDKLPLGECDVLAGLHYIRFSHEEITPRKAVGKLTANPEGNAVYTLHYPHNERSLSITFKPVFPFEIISWEETYRDGWGDMAAILTTKGVRKALLRDDYWSHHANQDSTYRSLLKMN